MGRAVVLGSLAVVLLAPASCLGPKGPPIEEQILGLPVVELRTCIGVPAAVEEDGAVEYQTYEFREVPPGDPFREYRRRNGQQIDPFGRDDEERYIDCQVAVEAKGRRVRKIEVTRAVDSSGLRDLGACRRALERCLPES